MKKVWKYLIISLLLLLGLCCAGILYLFFVPGSSLFNITYINKNVVKQSQEYSIDNISKIELNSRAYDVHILESENNTIYVKARSNSFGFVLSKNKNFDVTTSLESETLTIDVMEPHGFAATNLSKIELFVPNSKEFDLSLSNKKAETKINSSSIQIKNFDYSTERGDLTISKGKISGTLDLNLNKSTFKIKEPVETSKNDVIIQLTSGRFEANTENFGNVTISNNSRGIVSIGECKTLRENQKSAGGQINIEKAMHVNVIAADTIVNVKEISDTAVIELSKSGKVAIDSLNGDSSIITNNGSIKLGKVYSPITLYSENGNITVNEATLTVSVTVINGAANISFAEDAPSYLDNSNARVLFANIKDGTLIANGVEHVGKVNENSTTSYSSGILILGKGNVTINMKNIYGKNSIVGNNGNVNVIVNKDSIYTLKTSSTNGYVCVNLTQITDYGGYTTKELTTTNVNCLSSVNELSISTKNGSLIVLDTNFA